jgi:FkbM family methyltransferase
MMQILQNILGLIRKKRPRTAGYHRLDVLHNVTDIIDVGVGHQGSEFLYQRFPKARYISIDPLEEAIFFVKKRLSSTTYKHSFYQLALGSEPGEITINVSNTLSRSSTLKRTGHDEHSKIIESRKVKLETLDNIMQYEPMGESPLLKIDVEGAEFECLLGAKSTLDKVRYVIAELPLTENFKGSYKFSDVIKLLSEYDFEAFQVLKAGNNALEVLFSKVDDPKRQEYAYGTKKG